MFDIFFNWLTNFFTTDQSTVVISRLGVHHVRKRTHGLRNGSYQGSATGR